MARLATIIADVLAENGTIALIAGSRVFDRDYRADGWDNAPVPVFDADDVIEPTVIVTHGETVRDLGAPPGAEGEMMIVWALANRSSQGMDNADTLLKAAKVSLDDYHIPETKGFVKWQFRIGPTSTEDGSIGQSWFRVSGIPDLTGES